MALTTCPDCGRQLSDRAYACPGCGHPLRPPPKPAMGLWVGLGCLLTLWLTFCMAIIVGVLIWIGISVRPVDEASAEPAAAMQEMGWRQDCQKNLTRIALLKEEWANAHDAVQGTRIPTQEIQKIFAKDAAKLICPKDEEHSFQTSYDIGPIGTEPLCKCDSSHNEGSDEEK